VELLPGLYQIRLPIPIKSLKTVFAYFAQDGDESLLIDTGWPSQESLKALESALGSIHVRLNQIRKVLVSHLHPDHFGQAELIKQRSSEIELIMHEKDAVGILDSDQEYEGYINAMHEWLRVHGVPGDELEPMRRVSLDMLKFFKPARPNVVVSGGETIRVGGRWRFEVFSTPGHTPGTICLYDRGSSHVFFSGDHILPRITPNVSLTQRDKGDPLGDYLLSLERLGKLNTTEVLPSHEWVFTNLRKRIREIKDHHEARLTDALNIIEKAKPDDGTSAYKVATMMKWYNGHWNDLSPWNRRAAIMETLAHLEYLKIRGRLVEIDVTVEKQHKILYSLVGAECPIKS
jgi:glyoxylase-like metal-dependent hydrolase (beta-lactamase superfamily II)